MSEQRKYLRIRQKDVVTYEEDASNSDAPLHDLPAWLNNISEKGAAMETNRKLAIGTEITLQIPLEDEEKKDKTFWIHSVVRWIKDLKEGTAFEVGVEFVSIENGDPKLLHQFIEQHSNQSI